MSAGCDDREKGAGFISGSRKINPAPFSHGVASMVTF